MTEYLCHFSLGSGVMLRLTITLETKHHPEERLIEACERIANRLGATFIYFDTKAA